MKWGGSMHTYKLTLCYDGGRYSGWQRQGNTDNTIQARVEAALGRALGTETEVAGSGRTDAGVHARAQQCSFHTEHTLDCAAALEALRELLPEDIGALKLEETAPRFHARLSCREKTYVYRVWNSTAPNVFERRYMYRFTPQLDVTAMRRAAAALCGEHDFTAFCANRHMKKSAVRRMKSIDVERRGDEVRIAMTGDGFLYNMARIIAGTLLEVGTHRRAAEDVEAVLASRERANAGFTAPAQGLTLWEVRY